MLAWLRKRGAEVAQTQCVVTFADGRPAFSVPKESLLLAAALSAGQAWPHNCKVGTCGTCKTRVLSGRIKPMMDFALSPLTAEELRDGYVLACQSRVRENLTVDVSFDEQRPAIVHCQAEVTAANLLSPDVMQLHLTLDAPLLFEAGQYVDLSFFDSDIVRSYSLCEAPQPLGLDKVSFLIRRLQGGKFSERLFDEVVAGGRMLLHGPFGATADVPTAARVLALAGGTGLAPMLSLMRDRLSRSEAAQFTLMLGLRSQADTFAQHLLEPLILKYPGRITVQTWLSDEPTASEWSGARGLVTKGLTLNNFEIHAFEGAFLCGNSAMVQAARARLLALGVNEKNIHADAFSPSGSKSLSVSS
jgi:toluene methyl-monooxygenase electron transfer component